MRRCSNATELHPLDSLWFLQVFTSHSCILWLLVYFNWKLQIKSTTFSLAALFVGLIRLCLNVNARVYLLAWRTLVGCRNIRSSGNIITFLASMKASALPGGHWLLSVENASSCCHWQERMFFSFVSCTDLPHFSALVTLNSFYKKFTSSTCFLMYPAARSPLNTSYVTKSDKLGQAKRLLCHKAKQ